MPQAPKPLDVVQAFLNAIRVKDYDTALTFVGEDCEYTNIPMSTGRGPAEVRAVLEPFFAPTVENEFRILRTITEGDLVFTERLDRHRLPDRWVELPVAGVWQVRDGKIVVWREYFDAATILSVWPTA